MKIIRVLSKRVTGKKLLLPILMMSACTSTETLEPNLSLFRENAQPINISIDNEGSLPIVVNIVGKARDALFVENAMTEVTAIYEQCQIPLKTRVNKLLNSESEDISLEQLYSLTDNFASARPTVFVIDSTKERDVAFSYLPSINRDVSGTAWISNRVSNQCFSRIVAHEIGHILLDDAHHHPQSRNVMHARCSNNNNFNRATDHPVWSQTQCRLLKESLF